MSSLFNSPLLSLYSRWDIPDIFGKNGVMFSPKIALKTPTGLTSLLKFSAKTLYVFAENFLKDQRPADCLEFSVREL
ncbi:hypothetical protein LINPERPRIM_LOCUS25177 [Linum perenne]